MVGCTKPLLAHPLEVLEPDCFKFVLSKAVGYAIVAGSAGVKLPQVFAIFRARSVGGLAGSSIIIEFASTAASFAYFIALGYPFSTWGENFFLFFGQAFITALYFHYTTGIVSPSSLATFLPVALFGAVLYRRAVPDIVLPAALCELLGLPSCTVTCEQLAGSLPMALMLFGRLPQIVQNLRQGHTGQLSLITYLLNVAGNAARIGTTLQELDDKMVLLTSISALVQNGVLLAQILLLGGALAKKPAAPSKGPKKGE